MKRIFYLIIAILIILFAIPVPQYSKRILCKMGAPCPEPIKLGNIALGHLSWQRPIGWQIIGNLTFDSSGAIETNEKRSP